ncbi:hypothetical protein [Tenacibaculum finnmarkense]|uniref:Uncharacterized protein n=1 Tax=Tenacibaculum finnmarkense genomovar finnmarkense TaxID=1458503 RepID=A0AAP1WHF8_9FLAO|nr:hypothetical protein [Tenacibaculum finnmarkense]MBE7653997.1 hypothetical protein [Tenacibaculum finnmarkense genomovar finnmarkense]MBE7696295.1 hypothetical protein [Tenacibaculum finnmarkense genomovar finnmarkense]MCD8428535.1 hypothetical protein [Tenacibaculum finnmarkense genomovar finnmarkense]MCG8732321.1 hypothetical protein [Tenacibaculum finnmarkense]MCG8753058.1 hypothetical protein [Tenacibaculum finnmarkense]
MKTYFSDLIPKIQRYSKKLDDLTNITNANWIIIEEIFNSKKTYIFRPNNQLIISTDGSVEKRKWEYIKNNSLLIDIENESFLFKLGFLDANFFILKLDNKNEYLFLVNENIFNEYKNSINNISSVLENKYLTQYPKTNTVHTNNLKTNKGKLVISVDYKDKPLEIGNNVFLNGEPAPNGNYRYNYFFTLKVNNGKIEKI